MNTTRRGILKAVGATVPLLFSKRLLGAGNVATWVPEKPDEPIRVVIGGALRAVLHPVPLQRYLTLDAKKLYMQQVNSTTYEYNELLPYDGGFSQEYVRRLAPVMYMAKTVPLVKGDVPIEITKKWAAMLNHLASEKIWIGGTLLRTYYMPLIDYAMLEPYLNASETPAMAIEAMRTLDPHWKELADSACTKAALLTYIVIDPKYADDWSGNWLNDRLGVKVFSQEGGVDATDDWGNFPELR